MSRPQDDRNQEATVYLVGFSLSIYGQKSLDTFQGNLDERCTDALIWELMLQAGPVGMLFYTLSDNVHVNLRFQSECSLTQGPCLDGSPRVWF